MAEKITRNYKVSAQGVLSIDTDGRIFIEVEDRGEFELASLLNDFNNKSVKLNCSYDEDYTESDLNVDEETGEVI